MNKPAALFLITALLSLALALIFGILASIDFISTNGLINFLPFQKLRPLHVSLAVGWIFAACTGSIYFFIKGKNKFRYLHWFLFAAGGTAIISSYILGVFGGREYWEFPPVFAIVILTCWIIFGFNFFSNIKTTLKNIPVYTWMWSTGIIFFFLTYLESNLWIFSYFNENIVRDITVQWKSYGSLVGSWNMLVYGTAIYLVEKISGNKIYSQSNIAFSLFFLGLINLMFGWSHHIYFVPAAKWIIITGYVISMSELILLGRIIWLWKKNLEHSRRHFHILSYRFLSAADIWIFINIIVAIAISVPAINIYTHGTLTTAAHAMGSTIGINTMILLASVAYILNSINSKAMIRKFKSVNAGYYLSNISLLVFFLSLIAAGTAKGIVINSGDLYTNNSVINAIKPFYIIFIISGVGLLTGLFLIIIPFLAGFINSIRKKQESNTLEISERLIIPVVEKEKEQELVSHRA